MSLTVTATPQRVRDMTTDVERDTGIRATSVRWAVLAWLCTAGAIAYVHRNCIAVVEKEIRAELNLTKEQMGWVMGSFFLSYAVMQLPAAWLGSRWGNRRTLPLFMAGWSLATAWMGLAGGYVSLTASRLVNGTFQAGILPCSAVSVRNWFSVAQRSFPLGMLGSFQSVGAMIATFLTPLLLYYFDWRPLFVAFALVGVVWALGFLWWFREQPEDHPSVNPAELRRIRGDPLTEAESATASGANPATEPAAATPWLMMFTSSSMLLLCAQQFFRAAGYAFYGTWFPTFLQETRNVTMVKSALLTTLPVVAVAIGSAAGGGFSDWIHSRTGSRRLSRQAVAVFCMSACALCIFLAYFVESATQAVLLITFGSLWAGLGGPAGMTLTVDLGGRHVAPAFATMNMTGNFGAAICPVVVAKLVERTQQWNLVLLFFVAIYVAAAVCWICLNPDRPIFRQKAET